MSMVMVNTSIQVYVKEGMLVQLSVSVSILTGNSGESSEYVEWIGNVHTI